MKLRSKGLNVTIYGRTKVPLLIINTAAWNNPYFLTLLITTEEKKLIRIATADVIKENSIVKIKKTSYIWQRAPWEKDEGQARKTESCGWFPSTDRETGGQAHQGLENNGLKVSNLVLHRINAYELGKIMMWMVSAEMSQVLVSFVGKGFSFLVKELTSLAKDIWWNYTWTSLEVAWRKLFYILGRVL